MSRYSRTSRRGLYRSRNGVILGVCRGVADYFDFSVFWIRAIAVILFICTGFWPIVGVYILAALLMTSCSKESKPPVIVVVIDTLRRDRVGAYGYPRSTTPNLDRLAADGRRYDRAWSTSSWTTVAASSPTPTTPAPCWAATSPAAVSGSVPPTIRNAS